MSTKHRIRKWVIIPDAFDYEKSPSAEGLF
jgi:hypothetical protein